MINVNIKSIYCTKQDLKKHTKINHFQLLICRQELIIIWALFVCLFFILGIFPLFHISSPLDMGEKTPSCFNHYLLSFQLLEAKSIPNKYRIGPWSLASELLILAENYVVMPTGTTNSDSKLRWACSTSLRLCFLCILSPSFCILTVIIQNLYKSQTIFLILKR